MPGTGDNLVTDETATATADQMDTTATEDKKKGAPKKANGQGKKTETSEFVEGIEEGGTVRHLPIDQVDLDDEKFMFRARLRVSELQSSIADEGQQLPIIVRKRGTTRAARYQIISGFRRVAAIKALRWDKVAAIVRDDLDDEGAFRASVLENTARKSYSDIDRAIVIKRYEQEGHSSTDVASMMGLTRQMKNKLKSLLELPEVVQDAVDDSEHPLKTKHAITLKTLAVRYPSLDCKKWVTLVGDEELSVSALIRRVNKEHGGEQAGPSFTTIFQERGTDWDNGEFRLAPVKLTISAMTDEEKAKLKAELERVVAAL